ncbi:MAG: hypothetical protein OEX09_04025 [Candidatus Bathyarchaeota archaeon]|nr:hypothetical protein [Candidatus Bathyarchaeota archaeon]
MDKIHIIRNEGLEKVLIAVPNSHKHLRICLILRDGAILIFQEATIANISRAYITLKTHPSIKAQELKMKALTEEQRKEGYATHQLIETSRDTVEVEAELGEILEKGQILT